MFTKTYMSSFFAFFNGPRKIDPGPIYKMKKSENPINEIVLIAQQNKI